VLAGHGFVQLRHDKIEVIGLAKEFGTARSAAIAVLPL